MQTVWVVILMKNESLKEVNVYGEEILALDYFDGKVKWLTDNGYKETTKITGTETKMVGCAEGYTVILKKREVL